MSSTELDSEDDYTPESHNDIADTSIQYEDDYTPESHNDIADTSIQDEDDNNPGSDHETPDTNIQDEDGSELIVSHSHSASDVQSLEHSVMEREEGSLNGDSSEASVTLSPRSHVSARVDFVSSDSESDMDWGTSSSEESLDTSTPTEEIRARSPILSRERSWTFEECSICCDVMLKDQDIKTLPCTHRFHSGCILPWLEKEQQQTCPNCRKQAV